MRSPFIHDWLFERAAVSPGAPAVATPTDRVTYGELALRVRDLAAGIHASGVRKGDRVVLALPNTVATVVAGLALNSLGAISVEVNRDWGPAVLAGIVRQAGARRVIGAMRDARTWAKVHAETRLEAIWLVARKGESPQSDAGAALAVVEVLREDGLLPPGTPAAQAPPAPALSPDSPALVLYTSGSTGRPRGVVQTFGNLYANSRSIVRYLGIGQDDRALVVLPLFYCYGRSVLQTHLLAGASVFLEGRSAFPRTVMETLSSERCTSLAGVPLTFEILRRQVDFSTLSFPALRYLTQAGGAMAPATVDWVRETFRPARLFVMYGQTEATARLAYLPPEHSETKRGSIGVPVPGVELRVVDDDGRTLPPETVGNLVARGDNVTPGYLGEPEETAAILRDGWLWTGDLALQDRDGFLFHRGRAKEILKVGGHRVSPAEIEHVLQGHPDVAEVAVLGTPHDLLGEEPAALVVARNGRTPKPEDLRRFCQEHLPPFKVPATVHLVPSLPRNTAGKLLRADLEALRAGASPKD